MIDTISYEMIDVDYLENDAFIMFDDGAGQSKMIYFQWHTNQPPTIFDALDYIAKRVDA